MHFKTYTSSQTLRRRCIHLELLEDRHFGFLISSHRGLLGKSQSLTMQCNLNRAKLAQTSKTEPKNDAMATETCLVNLECI